MYKQRAKLLQKIGLNYQQSLELVRHYIKTELLAEKIQEERQTHYISKQIFCSSYKPDPLSPFFQAAKGELSFLYEEVELMKDFDDSINFSDVDYISRKIGTLSDIFSFDSPKAAISFWNCNVRALFQAYIELHESVDGSCTLIIRELDTLYSIKPVLSIHRKHLKQVILYLLSCAKELHKHNKLHSIAFERVENQNLRDSQASRTSSFLTSLGAVETNIMSLATPRTAYSRPVTAFIL